MNDHTIHITINNKNFLFNVLGLAALNAVLESEDVMPATEKYNNASSEYDYSFNPTGARHIAVTQTTTWK